MFEFCYVGRPLGTPELLSVWFISENECNSDIMLIVINQLATNANLGTDGRSGRQMCPPLERMGRKDPT